MPDNGHCVGVWSTKILEELVYEIDVHLHAFVGVNELG